MKARNIIIPNGLETPKKNTVENNKVTGRLIGIGQGKLQIKKKTGIIK